MRRSQTALSRGWIFTLQLKLMLNLPPDNSPSRPFCGRRVTRDERGGRRPLEAGLTATFFFKGHLCSQINKTTPGSSRSCRLLANSCSEMGVSAGEPSKHFSLPEAEHFSFCPQGALTLHAQMQGRLRTHQDGKSGELMWRYGGCLHVCSPVVQIWCLF